MKVHENVQLKKFNNKKIYWFRSSSSESDCRTVLAVSNRLRIDEKHLILLSCDQFIDLIRAGIFKISLCTYRVVLIKNLETLSQDKLDGFLDFLAYYRDFDEFKFCSVAVISSNRLNDLRLMREFSPIVVDLFDSGESSGGLNEHVHGALDSAMKITGQRVTKITEEVALWLEDNPLASKLLVQIFVPALKTLKQETVLTMRHIEFGLLRIDDPEVFDQKEFF